MEPKPPISRLSQAQREQLQSQSAQTQQGMEFASPEELIRFDAAQTAPPPAIEERLKRTLDSEPLPAGGPWWKRLFGR